MHKNINKTYAVRAANITIGEVYYDGGVSVDLRGQSSGWKIKSLVLPPSENIEPDLWSSGKTPYHLTSVLRHIRKVIYLATDPKVRDLVYHSGYDHESRRKLTLKYHTLGLSNDESLYRLMALEKHLMELLKFYSDEDDRRLGREEFYQVAQVDSSRIGMCIKEVENERISGLN